MINIDSAARVREPGLGGQWIGKERYVVKGRSVVAVPVMVGDELEIVTPSGRQPAHILAVDEQGRSSVEKLGFKVNGDSRIMAEVLNSNTATKKIRDKLSALNVDILSSSTVSLLGGDTPAGSRVTFISEYDLIFLLAAPGAPMSVDDSNPAADLVLFINRAQPGGHIDHALPDPLADELQSIRIDATTAQCYEVKKGEYIQIIDVDGRQCSDFQCFDKVQLDKGKTRYLSATTTRTLMGMAYPGPGLYGKFYDIDFQSLVEIVQDTCGRHDAFGLACTSKYYDEAGYPGHVNCSENFNKVLAPYPIEPRPGWQAMNLFFNTFFDDAYAFGFDDPWSRPGDFVLMRAMKDLICLSSACPCDIDPANGWVPTDIHVRVYSEKNLFKRAIAFRKTTDSEPQMTQETSFHGRTSQLTRNFSEYNGFWLADNFTNHGAIAEYWACRQGVIVTDLSPLRKYEVVGPDAELLLQTCVTRDIRKLSVGQVVYTAMCYESGGMIDDGTVFRLTTDNFRWVGGADESGLWLRQQAEELGLRAWVKDSTAELANLQVQGPDSLKVLSKIIWTRPDQPTVDELEWFRFSIARINDANGVPVIVSRTGYTGERGYEIFCHPDDAQAIWDAVWEAGAEFNIKPLGLEALDMLRIEAGLIFAGYEFCDQTDPFEAGIGFTVPLKTKQENFIGREALIDRNQNPQQKLVGLALNGEEPAVNGNGIFIGKEQVGTVTSGVVSPILGKNIALCRVKNCFSDLDTKVEVGKLDGHQKRIPAKVVDFPHYDPKKQRVRGLT